MKQIAYKIIVIASVLLGALGPQVASGNSVSGEVSTPSQGQISAMQVIDSPYKATNLSATDYVNPACSSQLDFTRLDLLLWQGCNQLDLAPQPKTPQIVVISQPTYLPTLIAQTPSSSWNLKMVLSSGGRQENSLLPILGFSLKPNLISKIVAIESSSLLLGSTSNFDQKNYMQIIVMRC